YIRSNRYCGGPRKTGSKRWMPISPFIPRSRHSTKAYLMPWNGFSKAWRGKNKSNYSINPGIDQNPLRVTSKSSDSFTKIDTGIYWGTATCERTTDSFVWIEYRI